MGLVLITSGFQCSNESKLIKEIPETTYINDCPDRLYEFGDMVSTGDPNGRFTIQLPYNWDIRESYGDSLYGIFSSNFLSVPKPLEEQMAVSVSGYTSDKDLDQYFHDELIELVKTGNIRVLEKGISMFAGQNNPWVLFEMQDQIFNMVYYVKQPDKDDIYLIQTVSYDTVNYKTKMCYLKQLVNSFEMIRY